MNKFEIDDYVLVTKWRDGDAQDPWCVGFIKEITLMRHNERRYVLSDENGKVIFSCHDRVRMKKISHEKGDFIVKNVKEIELHRYSLWKWVYMPLDKCVEKLNNAKR